MPSFHAKMIFQLTAIDLIQFNQAVKETLVIVTKPEVNHSSVEAGLFPVLDIVLVILPFFLLNSGFIPQRCIINNTHRLVELCVAKLSQDWFPLLELLAMATNPHCKFHIYNGTRPSETVPAGAQLADDELYARPPDPRSPKVTQYNS